MTSNDAAQCRLTSSQQKAVSHIDGPLLVLAGPGSGKTRVITFRIAALIDHGVPPRNICAITFTNKAAEQMRQRAAALGASAGAHISTFHSLCVRLLRRYGAAAGIKPNFSIYDDADQSKCIKAAVRDCQLDTANFPPSRMLAAVSTLKNKLIAPEAFKSRTNDFFGEALARVYARYQRILADLNALDFDDLLMKAAFMLEENPNIAAQLADRFRYLLIDEYQDTNHAQYRIARSLAAAHHNICATGDPDQSIYRWRGADIRNILAFEEDYPDALIVKLEENFRSTPNILEIADNLIAHNKHRKPKRLVPTLPNGHAVAVTAFEDEYEEARGLARTISDLIDAGVAPTDIAVFYRVNAMSRIVEEAFIRARIPYQIVRGVEFYNRKEIRDVLAYLKLIANPADEVALLRIINTPARGIGKTTLDRLANYASRHGIPLHNAVARAAEIEALPKAAALKVATFAALIDKFRASAEGPVGPLVELVFNESGLYDSLRALGPDGRDAIENVEELANSAAGYDGRTEEPSLVDFLQQIALFSDADAYDPSKGQVALMTLHAAKGLEFDNAFIIGLEEGLLPHERTDADDEHDLEEERRLLFVGITRAKSRLHISYARYRTIRGQMLRSVPSQFLFELGIPESALPSDDDDDDDFDADSFDTTRGRGAGSNARRDKAAGLSEGFSGPITRGGEQPSDVAPFTPGRKVRHPHFGHGTIRKLINLGPDSIIEVRFNTGQTKSLLLKYAHLEPL